PGLEAAHLADDRQTARRDEHRPLATRVLPRPARVFRETRRRRPARVRLRNPPARAGRVPRGSQADVTPRTPRSAPTPVEEGRRRTRLESIPPPSRSLKRSPCFASLPPARQPAVTTSPARSRRR